MSEPRPSIDNIFRTNKLPENILPEIEKEAEGELSEGEVISVVEKELGENKDQVLDYFKSDLESRDGIIDGIVDKIVKEMGRRDLIPERVRIIVIFLLSFLLSQFQYAAAQAAQLEGPIKSKTNASDTFEKEEPIDKAQNFIGNFFETKEKSGRELMTESIASKIENTELGKRLPYSMYFFDNRMRKPEYRTSFQDLYYKFSDRNNYYQKQLDFHLEGNNYIRYSTQKDKGLGYTDFQLFNSINNLSGLTNFHDIYKYVDYSDNKLSIPKDVFEKSDLGDLSYLMALKDAGNNPSFRAIYYDKNLNRLNEAKVFLKVLTSLDVSYFYAGFANKSKAKEEFFNYIDRQKNDLSENETVLFLQDLGYIFGKNYDYNIGSQNLSFSNGDVPIEDIISAAADYYHNGKKVPAGVCRHIDTALATIGEKMGLDTFTTALRTKEGGHVVTGIRKGDGNIDYLSYDWLFPTGEFDLVRAQSVLERYYGSITSAKTPITDPEGKIIDFIQTPASESMYEAAGVGETTQNVEKMLSSHERVIEKNGLSMVESPDMQSLKFKNGSHALLFSKFDGSKNDYNSLASMISSGFERGDDLGLSEGITIFTKDIKGIGTLNNGVITDQDIMAHLGYNFRDYEKLPGNFNLGLAAAIEGVSIYNISDEKKSLADSLSGGLTADMGIRLSYIHPDQPYSFFIQQNSEYAASEDNIQQNFKPSIKKQFENFKAGAEIKTQRVDVGLTGEYKMLGYGSEEGINAAIKKGNVEIKLEAGRADSNYETIFPSFKEGKIEITKDDIDLGKYKGAMTVLGQKKENDFGKYKKDENSFQVKMVILFQ